MKAIVTLLTFIVLQANAQRAAYVIDELKRQAQQEQLAAEHTMQRTSMQQSNTGNNYDVKYYRCEWTVDPAVRYIKGKVTSYFTITASTNTIIYDLMRNLTVDSVYYRNQKITYSQAANNTVQCALPTTLATGTTDSVSIYYQGVPTATGNGSFSLSTQNSTPILWTLSQPYGAKDWWPCKDALNDKADSVVVIITCPVAYRGSSNGLLISETINGTNKVMHYKHKYPITSYLVAIACTNYITTSYNWNIAGTPITFENWTYPGSSVNWFANEAYGVRNALTWFNDWIGPYPFANERYAHTQCNFGGGMEHQTNSFMGSPGHLLAAHELAHQWYGDAHTCGSWQHIWVNEGFASFMHWLYFTKHDVPTYYGILNEYHTEVTSDSSGSVIVPDTTNIGRIFSWRHTYVKGAYVLHILRGMLGDAVFFNGMKAYSANPSTRFGYATTEDVKRVFEQVSGKNLTEFFNDWVVGEGWPMHHINWYINNNGYISIKVNQRQSHPSVSFYEVPLQVQFKNATQDTILTLPLQQNGQLFTAKLNFVPDTVLVDPKLWILSKNNTQAKLQTNAIGLNSVQVYPSPAANSNWKLVIKNPTTTAYQVQVSNTLGQIVYTQQLTTNGSDVQLEIPNVQLAKGIYILKLLDNKEVLYTKAILK